MIIHFDAHAHLYDSYDLSVWCRSAIAGLSGQGGSAYPVVIVLDREGHDTFARFRREVPKWSELPDGRAGVCHVAGKELLVIRGVQYNTRERIEVLAFGCSRSVEDRASIDEILAAVTAGGGVPCLPWSPGKWLGARGALVRRLLQNGDPARLLVGDVAIRSTCGPPSSLLAYARRLGYRVVCGTDPLPRRSDQALVGSFGQSFEVVSAPSPTELVPAILSCLCDSGCTLTEWGHRNNPLKALVRFVSSNLTG